jgi:hypothetical protein
MATERFPKQKYIRQLSVMADDIGQWRACYLQAATTTTSDHLAGRFSGRAYVLEDVLHQIRELRDSLAGLPRIS